MEKYFCFIAFAYFSFFGLNAQIHLNSGIQSKHNLNISSNGRNNSDQSLTDYVDPFIGVENGGNVFPGATLPFGMVKLGPDMCAIDPQNMCYQTNSGYSPLDEKVLGFSHTHVSGTGGGSKYGNVLVMPFTGKLLLDDYSSLRFNEVASPGYFSLVLNRYQIKAELTATQRAGMHRYTFPKSDQSGIFIDAGFFLYSGQQWGENQELVGSEIKVISNTEIQGYNRVRGGWNMGGAYTVYFYARFDQPAEKFATWKGTELKENSNLEVDSGEKTGAVFYYKTSNQQIIQLKVGISFVSIEKAKQNLDQEISDWNFDRVHAEAVKVWNKELSKIEVETPNEDQKKIFYTALYHSMLMPVDRTGENPSWNSSAPYYDDFYAIWDTFRSLNPLLTLIDQKREVDIVNSMIDIYKHEGYMPDARSGNDNGRTQGGSNCDIVITDAFVKGLKGIDYETAYQAMIKNAEISPGGDERKEGRGGIEDYIQLGFVSSKFERAGSRTVEYANCDWAIAQLAKGLGKPADYLKYKKRASNWTGLWRDISFEGATGFIMPRNSDGSWVDNFSPLAVGSWKDFFYESSSWEYSLYVPQDVKSLIDKCGGEAKFISRLDTFFTKNYYNMSNEPGFFAPCLYSYSGRPDKTQEIVRRTLAKNYNSGRAGIPGNDDSGAMSSWYIFHTMGFFPNAGQDVYIFTAPSFKKATLHLESGKQLVITTQSLSEKNNCIQSVKLNGKIWHQSWFRHGDIKDGGSIEFIMGNKPNDWGKSNAPPSMSD